MGTVSKTSCVLCAQNCGLEVEVENNRSVEVELEVTHNARPGHVAIPHGFGLVYQGRAYGVNVNRLTKNYPSGFPGDTDAPLCTLPRGIHMKSDEKKEKKNV